ncbi:hypothetical protein H2201_007795 [Coniosporium apollinis]|uniref:t-SNARE coiled-coil homology domain-containing protein n=1 Tax=Coniosporium apollinis TaxID=61459 RepID=A0ABQ9NMA8_9PEZI|nr:hypothetical protein H2201_007795 [Coniosporium apollinis]
MSYGNYGQGGSGQSNPYAQQGGYGQANGYGDNYGQQGGYGNQDVEMQQFNGQPGYDAPAAGRDPNAILNECRDIDRAIDDLERRLDRLRDQQRRFLNDSENSQGLDVMASDIMTAYRSLGARVQKIKSNPESGNPRNSPQVGRVDRRIKKAIQDYQRLESDFRAQVREQQARQYRIVRPDATEEELLQSDRRGQAQSTLSNVRARHDAIQNIEKTMVELAQLFQDLNEVVVQQEPMIENIEQKGEEVNDNVIKANVEIQGATEKARSARRKKWWCLLIVILIIAIIAGVVGGVVASRQ